MAGHTGDVDPEPAAGVTARQDVLSDNTTARGGFSVDVLASDRLETAMKTHSPIKTRRKVPQSSASTSRRPALARLSRDVKRPVLDEADEL